MLTCSLKLHLRLLAQVYKSPRIEENLPEAISSQWVGVLLAVVAGVLLSGFVQVNTQAIPLH